MRQLCHFDTGDRPQVSKNRALQTCNNWCNTFRGMGATSGQIATTKNVAHELHCMLATTTGANKTRNPVSTKSPCHSDTPTTCRADTYRSLTTDALTRHLRRIVTLHAIHDNLPKGCQT